jgi:membrane-associated phospholipid phosphatase
MLHALLEADRDALEATRSLHAQPFTTFFEVVSMWWVKGPFLVAVALLADLAARSAAPRTRPWVPVAALGTAGGALLGSGLANLLKVLVDRARPAISDHDWAALIATPSSSSFPSGHAATAFGAATALALLHRRLRWPALALAALIAFSRVYLGVHYPLDVIAGSLIGVAAGVAGARLATGAAARRGTTRRRGSHPEAAV